MIEHEFRRIALAQGLLPAAPPSGRGAEPASEHNLGLMEGVLRPADNPGMAKQHTQNA